jgi:outer membrane lipoprotein SlyB
MKKLILAAVVALSLAGCATREDAQFWTGVAIMVADEVVNGRR